VTGHSARQRGLRQRRSGFALKRTRGSHHILINPSLPDALNLQPGPSGKAKPYQVRQLVNLVESYGLDLEE
jgi:predicted RNA binding protein YcfA (HicA-like mRNA interferase family)